MLFRSPLNSALGTTFIAWHVRWNKGCNGTLNVLTSKGAGFTFTTTDADGRFVLITSVPATEGGQPRLSYLVTHPAHDARVHELSFTRAANGATQGLAQIERDAAGVWRAAFGMTLA